MLLGDRQLRSSVVIITDMVQRRKGLYMIWTPFTMLEGKDEIVSLILFLGQEKFIAGDRNRDVRIRE